MAHKKQAARSYHPGRMIMTVLGINLIPIAVLLFCVALMNDYRERLIEMEINLLHTKTLLYAKTIEAIPDLEERDKSSIIQGLRVPQDNQLISFKQNADLIFKTPRITNLEPRSYASTFDLLLSELVHSMSRINSPQYNTPDFPYEKLDRPILFPGAKESFTGRTYISAWRFNDSIIFSNIIPIRKGDEIYASLLVVHSADRLTNEIKTIQNDVFRIFISILTLSVAFSLYLVGTITNPLRRLAKAVEDIRSGASFDPKEIPDMSNRGDEIGELSRALIAMVEALWDRMGTIEAFAADVSHELKNPITSIKSALETLPKVKDKKDTQQLLNILEHDIDRLDRLITDISKSTRLDSELSKGKSESINLVQFLYDIKKIYDGRRETLNDLAHIQIIDHSVKKLYIKGHREKLIQVCLNLVDNALSFSKKGDTVKIIVEEGKEIVSIQINDNGPGIPESKQEKIFDRFYSNRPKKEGIEHHSGLGLSIVKQIILAHDGTIQASNLADKNEEIIGASFEILLPIDKKVNKS